MVGYAAEYFGAKGAKGTEKKDAKKVGGKAEKNASKRTSFADKKKKGAGTPFPAVTEPRRGKGREAKRKRKTIVVVRKSKRGNKEKEKRAATVVPNVDENNNKSNNAENK